MADFGKALSRLRQDAPLNTTSTEFTGITSLSDQLRFLRQRDASRPRLLFPATLEELLPDGNTQSGPFGSHFVSRSVYPADHFHGRHRLERFDILAFQRLLRLSKSRFTVNDRERILFLDTETTGIQGGTGMVPFLVGLGYFRADEFHVALYFMRDFDEEASVLLALAQFAESFDVVVTYNGASFDMPLLQARYTISGQDNPFAAKGHYDLLPTARRFWRAGHGSCKLTALETRLLRYIRTGDIPGANIPRAYFDFLNRQSSGAMRAVFRHNALDILSLAALTLHASDHASSDPAMLDEPEDVYSLARVLEASEEFDRSRALYERSLQGGLPEPYRTRAMESLVVSYRRGGEHERAFHLCESLMARREFSFCGFEGAAIYFEKSAGDLDSARAIVDQALERLSILPDRKRWRKLFESRRDRLLQKSLPGAVSRSG